VWSNVVRGGLTDNDKTEHNYDQKQHKNLNKRTRKLVTYEQTESNETKAWFRMTFNQEMDQA